MAERYVRYTYGRYADGTPTWYPITESELLRRLAESSRSASSAFMRLSESFGRLGLSIRVKEER